MSAEFMPEKEAKTQFQPKKYRYGGGGNEIKLNFRLGRSM
jgi:hypothetical protein